MKKILMFHLEIHQMAERKFSILKIARTLKVSRTTVYKYLEMTVEEAADWANSLSSRRKTLDPYKEWIVAWLQEYPHMSAAQIKDWLLERYPDLVVADSTTRLYVNQVREEYQIEKTRRTRQYEAIEELPMGKQIQVDWGESKQKTKDNREVKLHCICFVLSHSRYKYIEWQDRPFTTRDTIRSHENAFAYYGGMPEEIVYDQDHLITVSENAGDIILTGEFQAYREQRGFRIYLCRKSDPESKGKIENVVKYVKYNFADSRKFTTIENWNERCMAWLKRTGNHNVHQTIKKRPDEVFLLEKQHLQPVSYSHIEVISNGSSITRRVNKDNTVIYKSNRYSVPIGTHRPKGLNSVVIEIQGEKMQEKILLIKSGIDGDVLARHVLSLEKGRLIKNKNHQRDRSKGIEAFKETVIRQFKNAQLASMYINQLSDLYPRYRRDQLATLQKATLDYSAVIDETLQKCVDEKLFSANDFRDVAKHLSLRVTDLSAASLNGINTAGHARFDIQVDTRPISKYTDILGGVSV